MWFTGEVEDWKMLVITTEELTQFFKKRKTINTVISNLHHLIHINLRLCENELLWCFNMHSVIILRMKKKLTELKAK